MQLFEIVLDLVYCSLLLAVSIFDLRERRVPNRIIFPAIVIAGLAMFLRPGWRPALLGALVGGGFMLIPVLAFGKKGGMGDVKLAFFMGLILGFPNIIPALIIAHVATLFLWVGVAFKWLDRRALIPFAPFLALGTAALLLAPYVLPLFSAAGVVGTG